MSDALFHPRLSDYLDSLVPGREPLLAEMEAEATSTGFPIIGPASGQLCYLIARLMGARRVFEMGSGFGYSTAWFARAVKENGGGEVRHVVWDEELSRRARASLAALGFSDIVRYEVGEAVAALRSTEGGFDLIFNDIEKEDYPAALPVIGAKLRRGGALIVDNLLWDGKIFDPGDLSPATEGIRKLTALVSNDPGWIASILPIRDGLLLAFKR